MVLKRVGPMSVAKLLGALYVVVGLIIGVCLAIVSMLGAAVASTEATGGLGLIFGVGAVIAAPVFYGIVGFVGGLIGAGLYNWTAGMVGGVQLELE